MGQLENEGKVSAFDARAGMMRTCAGVTDRALRITEEGETMATIAHRHRPAKMSDSPFLGCVAQAGQCSPGSHGRITRVQTCTCGATRRVNSDGLYAEERGPWTKDG